MNPYRLILDMVCIIAMVLCGGCALHDGDFALDRKLRIELSPPAGPLFYGVQVAQRGDELIISGFGRRPTPRGHVEVVVIGSEGTTLAQARADPLPPRAVPNRGYNYRFKASLPVVPPAGSTVRVAYVESSASEMERSNRGPERGEFVWAGPLTGNEIRD